MPRPLVCVIFVVLVALLQKRLRCVSFVTSAMLIQESENGSGLSYELHLYYFFLRLTFIYCADFISFPSFWHYLNGFGF